MSDFSDSNLSHANDSLDSQSLNRMNEDSTLDDSVDEGHTDGEAELSHGGEMGEGGDGEQGFSSDGDDGYHEDGRGMDEHAIGDSANLNDDLLYVDDPSGDPSQIRAPGGASSALTDAASRLASSMAAASEGDEMGGSGEFDEMDLEARQQRKRERELKARSAARHTGSQRSSRRLSGASASSDRRSDLDEKESGTGRQRTNRSSQQLHQSARMATALDDPEEDAFLDDETFSDGGGEYHSDLDDEDDDQEDDVSDGDEERTLEDVQRAKEEREHLIEVNKIRQRQIALILEREKAAHGGGKPSRGGSHTGEEKSSFDIGSGPGAAHPEQVRSEYIKNLESLNILWDTLESKREDAEEKIDRLTSKLDMYDERATELSDSFKSFKREICKEAKFSRTGKPIKLKRILAFEAAEEQKDRDVARVRLRHINLLNELRTLEDAVRVKEKLAEGLHLIDFEQLKIENQTLNEKIEERNDELHKLKKKTTTTVQVLTHIKEKLQCVKEESMSSQNELRQMNVEVQSLRDQLTRTKHMRDEARAENQLLKQKQGFIGSDLLVSDFENRKGDIELLRAKVEGLKTKWRNLNQLSLKANSVERQQARMENAKTQRQNHYATVKFAAPNAPSTTTNGNGRR